MQAVLKSKQAYLLSTVLSQRCAWVSRVSSSLLGCWDHTSSKKAVRLQYYWLQETACNQRLHPLFNHLGWMLINCSGIILCSSYSMHAGNWMLTTQVMETYHLRWDKTCGSPPSPRSACLGIMPDGCSPQLAQQSVTLSLTMIEPAKIKAHTYAKHILDDPATHPWCAMISYSNVSDLNSVWRNNLAICLQFDFNNIIYQPPDPVLPLCNSACALSVMTTCDPRVKRKVCLNVRPKWRAFRTLTIETKLAMCSDCAGSKFNIAMWPHALRLAFGASTASLQLASNWRETSVQEAQVDCINKRQHVWDFFRVFLP